MGGVAYNYMIFSFSLDYAWPLVTVSMFKLIYFFKYIKLFTGFFLNSCHKDFRKFSN